MGEWLRNSSKGERIGIVLSAVFAIFAFAFLSESFNSNAFEAVGMFVFYFGLPLVIGWGIYWIRCSPKKV